MNLRPINKEKKFGLDLSMMNPGDIVLTRDSGIVSKGIQITGEYSHAILFVNEGIAIDATGRGVQGINPLRIGLERVDDAVVIRCLEIPSASQLQAMELWARSKIGSKYSYKNAGLAGISCFLGIGLNRSIETNQFCSKFVAQAYESAGIHAFQYPASQTPSSLFNSRFHKVDGAVIAISEEVLTLISEDETNSKMAQYTNDLIKASKSALPFLKRSSVDNLQDLLDLAIGSEEMDLILTKVFMESDYYTDPFGLLRGGDGADLFFQRKNLIASDQVSVALAGIKNLSFSVDNMFRSLVVHKASLESLIHLNPDLKYARADLALTNKIIQHKRGIAKQDLAFFCDNHRYWPSDKILGEVLWIHHFAPNQAMTISKRIYKKIGRRLDATQGIHIMSKDKSTNGRRFLSQTIRESGIIGKIKSIRPPSQWDTLSNEMIVHSLSYDSFYLNDISNIDIEPVSEVFELREAVDGVRERFFNAYSDRTVRAHALSFEINKSKTKFKSKLSGYDAYVL